MSATHRPVSRSVFNTPVISSVLGMIGGFFLWVSRWSTNLELSHDRCVLVIAPHTSYWDFPILIAAALKHRVDARWIGTHRLFRGPGKLFFRWLGGIPVDRTRSNGIVDSVTVLFGEGNDLRLAVAPEGTRFRTEKWKTGFYRIAVGAGVPIGLVSADYSRKHIELTSWFTPTGNISEDFRQIADLYGPVVPHRPEWFAPPTLDTDLT